MDSRYTGRRHSGLVHFSEAVVLSCLLTLGACNDESVRVSGETEALSAEVVTESRAFTPDVLVQPKSETATSEGGKAVQVAISLARMPMGVVTVLAESSDPSEARVSDPVRFNRFNWRRPQVMVVTGVDDDSPDGDVAYDVRFAAGSSLLPNQKPVEVAVLPFTNLDDDEELLAARFEPLGTAFDVTGSWLGDVSAAGDVVVGWTPGRYGNVGFRWTPASQMQILGADTGTARAHGVSPDGALIVGMAAPIYLPDGGGAIWRGNTQIELLTGTADFTMAAAHAVTDQGKVYGECRQAGNSADPVGCVWSGPGQLAPLHASIVFAADALGNFAGTLEPASAPAPQFGSVAILNGTELPYARACVEPHECRAEARGFTTGAAVVVGTSLVPAQEAAPPTQLVETAFVYTSSAGSLPLPSLSPDQQGSGAYDVSSDGQVIGGYVKTADGSQAVIWVARGPLLVADLLDGEGNAGWALSEVRAVSADGLTLVGNAVNPSGRPEAFRVVLSTLP